MRINHLKTGIVLSGSLLLLSGCVDDNYDLSDIDTTTELTVNDLIIPIRVKPIKLDNVLDIDEDDPDAMLIVDRTDPNNPVYAIRKTGDFSADDTKIEKISADAKNIESTFQTATGSEVSYSRSSAIPGRTGAPVKALKFSIGEQKTYFDYDVTDIDKAIYTIESVMLENSKSHKSTLSVRLGSTQFANAAKEIYFENVSFMLPEGTEIEVPEGCTYKDWILTVPQIKGDPTTGLSPYFEISMKNFEFETPIRLKNDNEPDAYGACNVKKAIGIKKADVYVIPKSDNDLSALPSSINIQSDYKISDLLVNGFSGNIRYAIDINGIPDVDLTNIPDFLAGEETDLTLFEPKFTLNINNPVAQYNLGAVAGLSLIQHRENQPDAAPIYLNEFSVGNTGNGPWTVIIGPREETKQNGFTVSYNFPGLANILSGKGLPNLISIMLSSSKWPSPVIMGAARKFPLGTNIEQIDGQYIFYTPFALCDGSTIVYTKDEKDWDSEDLDKIKATVVKVSGRAVTNLPCSVQMSCALLDRNGNVLPFRGSNTFTVPANASGEEGVFELELLPADPTVPFQHIDGITFTAKATQTINGEPITPNQSITIHDVRFKVTGSYTTDF